MKNILIKTNYEKENRPAWTIEKVIFKKARFVRQSSSLDRFAMFDIEIEPTESEGVWFQNKGVIEDGLRGDKVQEENFNKYVDAARNGIQEFLNKSYESNRPISKIKFSISNLLINTTDSSEMCYKLAAYLALKECLIEDNLIML